MDSVDLKQFETRVVMKTGDTEQLARVISGSRMLVSLLVTSADPGASVSLTVQNAFEVDDGYETLETITLTAPGRNKKIYSDFHNLFRFTVNVTGGSAEYKVGISLYDNAITTRIDNAHISVDLDAASGDNVGISDGTDLLQVNPDGSINVQLVDDDPNDEIVNPYAEVLNVADGVPTDLLTYTVPGDVAFAQMIRIEASGENIAEYQLLLNGDEIGLKRSWWGGNLNIEFAFFSPKDVGYKLAAGDVILLRVTHYRPAAVAKFEARLQALEHRI